MGALRELKRKQHVKILQCFLFYFRMHARFHYYLRLSEYHFNGKIRLSWRTQGKFSIKMQATTQQLLLYRKHLFWQQQQKQKTEHLNWQFYNKISFNQFIINKNKTIPRVLADNDLYSFIQIKRKKSNNECYLIPSGISIFLCNVFAARYHHKLRIQIVTCTISYAFDRKKRNFRI